jgi:hypothetical protein
MSKNTYAYLEDAENLTFEYYGDKAQYGTLIGGFASPNPTHLVDLLAHFNAVVLSFVDTNDTSIDGATDNEWLTQLRTLYVDIYGSIGTAPNTNLLIAAVMHHDVTEIPADTTFPFPPATGSCAVFLDPNYATPGHVKYLPFLLIKDTYATIFSAFDDALDSDGNADTTPCLTFVVSKNSLVTDGHSYIVAKLHRRTNYSEKDTVCSGNKMNFIKFPSGSWSKPYGLPALEGLLKELAIDAYSSPTVEICPLPNFAARGTAKVLNGSQLRFAFSEKAYGAHVPASYNLTLGGSPVTAATYLDLTRDPAGTSSSSDGFLASELAAGAKEVWIATLKGLVSGDNGKIITFDPTNAATGVKAGNADIFAATAPAVPPLAFTVDAANAATDNPYFEVMVVEDEGGTNERRELLVGHPLASPGDVELVLDVNRKLKVRLVTDYPGNVLPSAILTTPSTSFNLQFTGLVAADIAQTHDAVNHHDLYAPGTYTLTIPTAYVTGAGVTINPAVYSFQIRDSVAELSHWQNAIEGWGYYPCEEGTPEFAPETGEDCPGIPTLPPVPTWTVQGTDTTSPTIPAYCLDIKAAVGKTNYYSRGYASMFTNATPVGNDDSGHAYIEARMKVAVTGLWGSTSVKDFTNPAFPTVRNICTSGAGIGANNGPCKATLELVDLDASGANKTVALRVYGTDGTDPAFVFPAAGTNVDWTMMHTYRLERSYSGTAYVWTAYVDGVSFISNIAESRFFREYDDATTRSAVRFGVLSPPGFATVTCGVEFVRYAFLDKQYQDALGLVSVGFTNLRRASADKPFFRSPDIQVSGLDAHDIGFQDTNVLNVTATVGISGSGAFSGKKLPVKIRLLKADFPDQGGAASVAGFRDCGSFPAYNGNDLLPIAGTSSVRMVKDDGTIDPAAWSIDVDHSDDARRVFLLACVDSPVLPTPELVHGAVCYTAATSTPGYFDPTEVADNWTGNKRTVIRQFLPDFFVRDIAGDTGSSPGGWMSPDITLAIFPGPVAGTPPAPTHVLPDPQSHAETKYPAGFACGKSIGYLPDSSSPINSQLSDTDHSKDIYLTDGAYTDYAPSLGASATACYMNRVWVRLSNRGIVPGPANVQVFFIHDVFRAEWGDESSSRDMAYEKFVANQMGTSYIQNVFQKYAPGAVAGTYDVSTTQVIPALSGAAYLPVPPASTPTYVIAEFVLHMPAGTIAAATSATTETTGDKIHGCRAAVINLIDRGTTPITDESSGVDDCVIDKSGSNYPDVQSATVSNNNVSIRNTDLIVGSPPPPPDDPDVTPMMLHVDPATEGPETHQDTGPGYMPTFGKTQARWAIHIDATDYPAGEVIMRLDRRLAGGAFPSKMIELLANDKGDLVPLGGKGSGVGAHGSISRKYRFFLVHGGQEGILDGLNNFDAWSLKEREKPLPMPLRLYARTDSKAKPGVYSVVMKQTADKRSVGGYTLTIIVPDKGGIRYIGDRRTGVVYDAKENPEAFGSIPYHRQRDFLQADQAVQHRMYLNPRTLEAFKANKLKTTTLNVDRKNPILPMTESDFFPGGLAAAIVGRVVDQKGQGLEGIAIELRSKDLGEGVFKATTDAQGRYLVTAEDKKAPGMRPGLQRSYSVEIQLKSKDGKAMRKLSLKERDLFFAAKPIVMRGKSRAGSSGFFKRLLEALVKILFGK